MPTPKPKPSKAKSLPKVAATDPAPKRKGGGVNLVVDLVQAMQVAAGSDEKGSVSVLADSEAMADVTEFISTGIPGVDRVLGGGFAVGRASEVFGPYASGKTALAHLAIRSNQRAGGTPVLFDFEAALDLKKMEQLGIDPTRLIYSTPKHVEQCWDMIWALIEALEDKAPDVPTLIVWDSVATSTPKDELEAATVEKSHVGLLARAMTKGCRRMLRAITRVRAHMLWINQERANIGGFGPAWMQEKKTAGGEAIGYAVSQRLRCQRVLTLKDGDQSTGYKIKVQTKKNRIVPPQQKAEFVIDFGLGPSPALSVFADLLDARAAKPAGRGPSGMRYSIPWLPDPVTKAEFVALYETNVPQAIAWYASRDVASADD